MFNRRCPQSSRCSLLATSHHFTRPVTNGAKCLQKGRLGSSGPASRVGCKSGAFIVFEGIDRSGKSTQCKELVKNLVNANVQAEHWTTPDRTSLTGKIIDRYLKKEFDMNEKALHFLFSVNRWGFRDWLLKQLAEDVTIVMDRYAFSGAVYTASEGNPEMDLEWAKFPDRGLPAPDLVLYMNMPIEAAAKRGEYGKERYENEPKQREVQRLFSEISKDVSNWKELDATRSIQELSREVFDLAMEEVKAKKTNGTLPGALWID